MEVLDSSVAGEFIQTNHLQGVGNGAMIHLGLVMDSNILSVMTFYDHKDSWEIKRFASLPNISIMGAAGKLYNYFLNNYHPNNVFSYSDNRYFDGKIYKLIGLDFEKIVEPGFSYSLGSRRYHRLNFTKQKLIESGYDANLSVDEIMKSIGYDKIWDAGHKKWSKSYSK